MIISSFSVYDSKFKRQVDRLSLDVTSETDFVFPPIEAKNTRITDREKEMSRDLLDECLLAGKKPVFDFTYGSKRFSGNTAEWEIEAPCETEPEYRGGKTSAVTLSHKSNGLSIRVEATLCEETATCAWKVFIIFASFAYVPTLLHPYNCS